MMLIDWVWAGAVAAGTSVLSAASVAWSVGSSVAVAGAGVVVGTNTTSSAEVAAAVTVGAFVCGGSFSRLNSARASRPTPAKASANMPTMASTGVLLGVEGTLMVVCSPV